MKRITVSPARPADATELGFLRWELWPESTIIEHFRQANALLAPADPARLPHAIFVALDRSGRLIGFVEAGLRSYAEGCDPSIPAGYNLDSQCAHEAAGFEEVERCVHYRKSLSS